MYRTLDSWLAELPIAGDYFCISEPRRFHHDETAYDAQYGNDPDNFDCGHGVINLAREHGVDMTGPALEIGCGTGLLSLGLVDAGVLPGALLTDPSSVFLQITADKLRRAGVSTESARFALFTGESADRLPKAMFSLIVLRSTLHHMLRVDRFLHDAARALQPGGAIIFQEPCQDGYVLMGALAQFLAPLCAADGAGFTEEDREKMDMFINTMKFYARRDVDKAAAEDKHVFRVDELMTWSREAGLSLNFLPNRVFEHFATSPSTRPRPDRFKQFFYDYLKSCMSFGEPLMELFVSHLGPYCDWVDSLCDSGAPPYMHGVFIAQRDSSRPG